MDIRYLGSASHEIDGEQPITINPNGKAAVGNLVLYSARQPRRKLIINGPGEYEIGGVLIVTQELGKHGGRTLAHAIEVEGLNVVHLGSRLCPITDEEIAQMGSVDVLMIPVDDVAAAQEIVSALRPRVVLPYGEKAAELCAALGLKDVRLESRFSWNGAAARPKAVLLKAPRQPASRQPVTGRSSMGAAAS